MGHSVVCYPLPFCFKVALSVICELKNKIADELAWCYQRLLNGIVIKLNNMISIPLHAFLLGT